MVRSSRRSVSELATGTGTSLASSRFSIISAALTIEDDPDTELEVEAMLESDSETEGSTPHGGTRRLKYGPVVINVVQNYLQCWHCLKWYYHTFILQTATFLLSWTNRAFISFSAPTASTECVWMPTQLLYHWQLTCWSHWHGPAAA